MPFAEDMRQADDHEQRIRALEALVFLVPVEVYKHISSTGQNEVLVLDEPAYVYGWFLSNVNSAIPNYLKLFDKATAPVLGSDTPRMTVGIPEGSSANNEYSHGIKFDTGLGFALDSDPADAGSTGVIAEEVIVNLMYLPQSG
jgi:hypothetical protein